MQVSQFFLLTGFRVESGGHFGKSRFYIEKKPIASGDRHAYNENTNLSKKK